MIFRSPGVEQLGRTSSMNIALFCCQSIHKYLVFPQKFYFSHILERGQSFREQSSQKSTQT